MKAYWLVRCNVKDADIYGEYIKLAGPAIEKHGGRYLVRGGQQAEVEGEGYERYEEVGGGEEEFQVGAEEAEVYDGATG